MYMYAVRVYTMCYSYTKAELHSNRVSPGKAMGAHSGWGGYGHCTFNDHCGLGMI